MPNNKTTSEISSIESKCRVCLTRTLTDPDLHARLKGEERISMKKNNFHRFRFLSFSSVFSDDTASSLPRTPYHTPSSSYASIVKFYFSSSSSSEISETDCNDTNNSAYRRYTF